MRTGQQPSGHGFGSPGAAPRATNTDTVWGRATGKVLAYIALTKPRVIELLLVATIPAMLLADRGTVDIVLILSTLFGGWMGAASANSLNCGRRRRHRQGHEAHGEASAGPRGGADA